MTEQEKEKLMQNPRVRKFIECGDEERASLRVSMAYILLSVAITMQEEANDILSQHGLVLHNVKFYANRLEKAFDQYHYILRSMMPSADKQNTFATDVEVLNQIVDAIMNGKLDVKYGSYFTPTVYLQKPNN